jgi:hypothetical protein
MSVFALAFYQPRANLQDGDEMSDEYLGKPCSLCGKRIQGANWLCSYCGICICYFCLLREGVSARASMVQEII